MALGIVELKKAIVFSLDLAEQIVKSAKNGIKWTDAFGFIDEVMMIPEIIKSGDAILAELRDLDPEEREQLNEEIAEEFDLDNEDIELVVERALDAAFGIVYLVEAIKQRNASKE